MELRILAGWENNSAMPAVYVHLSGADVERRVLERAGLVDSDNGGVEGLEPLRCLRCGSLNAVDAKYCSGCSMVLDRRVAEVVVEKEGLLREAMERLLGDEDVQRLLLEKLSGGLMRVTENNE